MTVPLSTRCLSKSLISSNRRFQMLPCRELVRQLLRREHFLVHPYDQDLFVVGTIVNANAAPLGQCLHRPPQIGVILFLGDGALKL